MTFYINKTNLVVNKIKFVQAKVTHYLKKVFPKHKYNEEQERTSFSRKAKVCNVCTSGFAIQKILGP